MRQHQPDFIKIATMSHGPQDNHNLFKLLLNHNHQIPMILIGMSPHGRATRILMPLLGAYLTYASIDDFLAAPGQIPLNELKSIYQQLQVTN
jgi:3-dehydroquinate dehydratase-1